MHPIPWRSIAESPPRPAKAINVTSRDAYGGIEYTIPADMDTYVCRIQAERWTDWRPSAWTAREKSR